MHDVKTREVLKEVGLNYNQLFARIIRPGLVTPRKDASGNYWWTPGQVRTVKRALEARTKRSAETGK